MNPWKRLCGTTRDFTSFLHQKSLAKLACWIGQVKKVIGQLGGVEALERFERKVGEEQGEFIIEEDEPLCSKAIW